MSQLRYVVASLPRSGTKYTATVLSKLGLVCGHEDYFNATTCRAAENGEGVFGDASWMAVPYIHQLAPGSIVFHQVRDPLKVLNSNLPPGGDSYFRTWDEHAGLASDPFYERAIPWKRFIWRHTQNWVWPPGCCKSEAESPAEISRLVHWWTNWNLWLEYAAMSRSDLTYVRYRLEDLSSSLLTDIASVILRGEGSPIPEKGHCAEILKEVSTVTNRHRTPNTRITAEHLPPAARLLAHRYGYYYGTL